MLEQGKAGEVLTELGRPGGENWKRTDGREREDGEGGAEDRD